MSASFTRQRQRRLARAAKRVDLVTQADARFFERFPNRNHRLRTASRAEVESLEALHGSDAKLRPGCRWYCIVRQIAPGARLRHYVPNVDGIETELPEEVVRAIYETHAPEESQAARVETTIRGLLTKRGVL